MKIKDSESSRGILPGLTGFSPASVTSEYSPSILASYKRKEAFKKK
jgi:hypothetical protein